MLSVSIISVYVNEANVFSNPYYNNNNLLNKTEIIQKPRYLLTMFKQNCKTKTFDEI